MNKKNIMLVYEKSGVYNNKICKISIFSLKVTHLKHSKYWSFVNDEKRTFEQSSTKGDKIMLIHLAFSILRFNLSCRFKESK